MNKAFIKKYGTLLLLATGAGIIFQLPYIRETFYVPIQNAMNLSNAQMGLLSSGYATMSLFSYFIGGIIADKFSSEKAAYFLLYRNGCPGTLVLHIPWLYHKPCYLRTYGYLYYYHLLVRMHQGNAYARY